MAFIYQDVNQFFPTTKPTLNDIEAVYGSIFNILNTRKGEELFDPEFGIDLEDQLFELLDDLSALEIFRQVVEALERYEPRVVIDTSKTTITAIPEEGKFELVLEFGIIGVEADGQSFSFKGSLVQSDQGIAA